MLLVLLLGFETQAGAAEPEKISAIRLLFPCDGLILTQGYDISPEPGLQVPLIGLAPSGSQVWVNGEKAAIVDWRDLDRETLSGNLDIFFRRAGPNIRVDYPTGTKLVDPNNYSLFLHLLNVTEAVVDVEVVALHKRDVFLNTVVLYYHSDPTRTYSITIDDVSDLFAEMIRDLKSYSSIFQHPILRFLRKMHQKYGTVFSLYLFKEGTIHQNFDLSQTTDRFKSEWEQNAEWLRLGFHAERMRPPRPYSNATYDKALNDLIAVREQVFRFAGEKIWDPFMRSHHWSGSRESCRAWRDAGIRGFYGALKGHPAYYLTPEINRVLNTCDYWRDNIEDIVFIQTDLWIEKDFSSPTAESKTSQDVVLSKLDSLLKRPYASQNVQIFTHESFLLPHAASWHVPERIEETIVYLRDRGYVPRFDANDTFFASLSPSLPYDVQIERQLGASISLAWTHARRHNAYRYLIFQKDISVPLSPWVQAGETVEQRFRVDCAQPGPCAYRVFAVDADGRRSGGSSPIILRSLPPTEFPMNIYPNPFNQSATIFYNLPGDTFISVVIYNVIGQEVRRLVGKRMVAGRHTVQWDAKDHWGRDVGSGVYIARIKAGLFSASQKMLLLK